MPNISHLYLYPLKSAAGLPVTEAFCHPEGLQYDRQFMVIDQQGVFLTARRHPALLKIHCTLQTNGWLLQHPDYSEDCLLPKQWTQPCNVRVWQDAAQAWDAGDKAADWISTVLKQAARMVKYRQNGRQSGKYQLPTRFADAAPLLLVGDTSMEDICKRAGLPMDIRRFRPNIVIHGLEAFAEEHWQTLSIGGQRFQVMDTCERCILTTRDPDSGQAHPDKQPIKALSQYHVNARGKPILGINIKPVFTGYREVDGTSVDAQLHIGDSVIVE